MPPKPTVFVVDDDEAMRQSLERLMEAAELPVRSFASGQALLSGCGPEATGCLLLDLRMPEMNGLELQQELSRRKYNLSIIILTAHGDVPQAVQALKAGAMDFIEKPFNARDLLQRVREALAFNQQVRLSDAQLAGAQARLARLTPRETEVMRHVVAGKLNKQIAAELGLSPKTVEIHRAHVMRKLKVGSLAELVRLAIQVENAAPTAQSPSE